MKSLSRKVAGPEALGRAWREGDAQGLALEIGQDSTCPAALSLAEALGPLGPGAPRVTQCAAGTGAWSICLDRGRSLQAQSGGPVLLLSKDAATGPC